MPGATGLLRNLRFQSKLVLVLMVPLVSLAVFSAIGVRDRLAIDEANRQFGELVDPSTSLRTLSQALEDESVASSWYMADPSAAPAGDAPSAAPTVDALIDARETTNQALAAMPDVVRQLEASGIGSGVVTAADELAERVTRSLEGTRADVDGERIDPSEVRDSYLALDSEVFTVTELMARALDDATLSTGVLEVLDLGRVRHSMAREAGVMLAALTTGELATEESNELFASIEAGAISFASFAGKATPEEMNAFEESQSEASSLATFTEPGWVAGLVEQLPGDTSAEEWSEAADAKLASLSSNATAVADVVADSAASRGSDARQGVLLYSAGVVLAIVASLLLAWAVTRSTTRPLQRLTRAARRVSQHDLPQLVDSVHAGGHVPDVPEMEPITVSSARDEIGELEEAFNAIQSVTVGVAQEQAALLRRGISDLYVNLARRNQSLLDRQLEVLDRLEAGEEDPATLDALFALDQLATRMRRNAESLLVLAGSEQHRRWREPVPVLDVVRAASAEIADFERVSISGIDHELAATPAAAADLTHLVAELLENATSFSPPVTPVEVTGAWADDGFVLEVTDQGLGMAPDRLAEANELLAHPPAAGLALSRVLGLFVVSHLAARHRVSVVLRAESPRGLTAVVTLPKSALAEAPAPAAATNGHPEPKREVVVPQLVDFEVDVEDVMVEPAPVHEPIVEPVSAPLASRRPGDHLLHLPVRGQGVVDMSAHPSSADEAGQSRAEHVRDLLAEHRRGIERADTWHEGDEGR